MDFGSPEFVLAIIALSTGGWLINNWIRARHGYALEDEWGGKTGKAEAEPIKALRDENQALRAELSAYADRTKVLERIVTDKGFDVASQIEALRDARRTEALIDSREPQARS